MIAKITVTREAVLLHITSKMSNSPSSLQQLTFSSIPWHVVRQSHDADGGGAVVLYLTLQIDNIKQQHKLVILDV